MASIRGSDNPRQEHKALVNQGAAEAAQGPPAPVPVPVRTITFTELMEARAAQARALATAPDDVEVIEVPDSTPRHAGASLWTGIRHTFGVAKWTVSSTFTWSLRAVLWIVPTSAGFLLDAVAAGLVLWAITPESFLGYTASVILLILAGIIPGAIIALGQMLALRSFHRELGGCSWFMLTLSGNCMGLAVASCVGWFIGMTIGGYNGIAFGTLAGLLLFGSIVGILQVGILKAMAVRHSWLWVIPSAVGTAGFALGVALSLLTQQVDIIAASAAGGVVYGVVTGISLSLLIRRSVQAERLANSQQDDDY
ncbi:MAG TPA: hypothetical protein VGE45_18610 [Chloroflexia bacterium]|jgi:hypothetical protein